MHKDNIIYKPENIKMVYEKLLQLSESGKPKYKFKAIKILNEMKKNPRYSFLFEKEL